MSQLHDGSRENLAAHACFYLPACFETSFVTSFLKSFQLVLRVAAEFLPVVAIWCAFRFLGALPCLLRDRDNCPAASSSGSTLPVGCRETGPTSPTERCEEDCMAVRAKMENTSRTKHL